MSPDLADENAVDSNINPELQFPIHNLGDDQSNSCESMQSFQLVGIHSRKRSSHRFEQTKQVPQEYVISKQKVYEPSQFDDKLEKLTKQTYNQSLEDIITEKNPQFHESNSDDWETCKKTNFVELVNSRHPSYTFKNIDYSMVCDLAYSKAKKKYNSQLLREMENICHSTRICDQFFTKRLFTYATTWPPLHTKAELNLFIAKFFQLPPKQKRRLNYLMTNDIV